MLAIGLMSGTSLDGVDAALVRILPSGSGYDVALQRFETHPFESPLREDLPAALPPNAGSVAAVANLHHRLGCAYAHAARQVAGSDPIDYVASHGQTVWHDGRAGMTLQIGDPFVISELLDATVCFDFRSADCAAGGHGAPLVARVDALLLSSRDEDRVALNLGGIANVTLLRSQAVPEQATAFDTGPGNMLIDAFVSLKTNGSRRFDANGGLAGAGSVDADLLATMLADDYFSELPPKTTGREDFGSHFLMRQGERLERMSLEDGAATLTELTAISVGQAIERAGFAHARIIVSGGGAHNSTLLARLAARLKYARVETSDRMGIPIDAKEAMAFAVLGYETLRGRPGNVPAATGARHPVVLGAIAPRRLSALIERVGTECRSSS
ncbi:MAG TPA: anhydro-N-acetylmuramic acid kinase [Candidatus Cybelea sp.]|jgi:anhydro-N-acetylmuramic acid kinase|nr:anhydro-N-acetylmuramic acid kinase [Candidatus Cybelea sp.]